MSNRDGLFAMLVGWLPLVLSVAFAYALYSAVWPYLAHATPYASAYTRLLAPSVYEVKAIVTSRFFYLAVLTILLLEWLFPAKRNQRVFSVGLAHDAVWLLLQAVLEVTVIAGWANVLSVLYTTYLGFLTIEATQTLPVALGFAIAVLAGDLLGWFHHWIRHEVPWFWEFHVVHHSQRELNMFTDLRYHAVEYIIALSIKTIPLAIIGVPPYRILYYGLLHTWFTRLYHSNIRTNFGLMRYVFVTPQSHRIHHSIEARHRDKNFGVLFSFWDRLFRTQYESCEEYPDTGVADERFPHEKAIKWSSLLWTPVAQHIYPFQAIGRRLMESRALAGKA